MFRRFQPKSTPLENLQILVRSLPWKLLLVIPILLVFAIPTYLYGSHLGSKIVPSITTYFYNMGNSTSLVSPTPLPAYPMTLPQVGSVLYTVQDGDSCDSILADQMHMYSAGHVFSDANPVTVNALNASLGHSCDRLQPGLVLPLSAQYPLIALGGVVLKISASTPQQVLPTPLIRVTREVDSSVDCSDGCLVTVRIAADTQVRLQFQTTLPIRVGSWVWAQARIPRKQVPKFGDYPYVDPQVSLNNATLPVCDLQVDNAHDDNSASCDELTPNTIDDDNGSWLLGVVAPGSLNHWHYPIHVAQGTPVMLWLTNDNGTLKFHPGNPVFRYDDNTHLYVKA